jgi:hypothetical protein
MSIAQLKLDESTKLEFGVSITGADGKPDARFIIDGKNFSVSFPAKQTNEGVEVDIQGLQSIFTAGVYDARLEIVLENKIYTPLIDKIEFVPTVNISTNSKVVAPVKESVKVAKVTVKKSALNEDQMRKTQAATIIANALGYSPDHSETPKEIINHALASVSVMTNEQIETVREMLALAEAVGIDYNKDLEPVIAEAVVEPVTVVVEDDGWSDADIDELVETSNWEDILSTYGPGELVIVDEDTGEVVDELVEELDESQINEVLSRAERIRAKVRWHKSETKRERKLSVALKKHSTNTQINSRARHMAIKAMKQKLAKKPLDQLSVGEKERIEGIIAKRGNVVKRLAMKMTQRVRQIEKDRLSHKSTKAA